MAVRAASRVVQATPAVVFYRRTSCVPALVEAPQLTLSRDAPQWQMPHNVWSPDSLNGVRVSAMQPHTFADHAASFTTQALNIVLDLASGFTFGRLVGRESSWLRRLQLLETAATAPATFSGLVAKFPLRQTRLDRGWLRALSQSQQSASHLSMICAARGVRESLGLKSMAYVFGVGYLLWPRFGKWCVDHSQEALIRVYAQLLEEMDEGELPTLRDMPAPEVAVRHYGLSPEASLRDVVERIHLEDRLAR
ncbi:unnamed protein product [Effrenium voratum]|uniref:Uncharacterized protein n=1 Tax=Effrenium voratum TaxID=2562239 RepID=A0AA36N874_9DINO|nr:unnamed protein product [Effrenium voratum]CAJ1450034.1 unnamed protein product [Effrenium voratum]|mmetsp:Transcript_59945/g.143163  ORF Transcript_59945/g.143163 Transcript_59945/m.143163 type:complete len:251 (+) Transcript_59945:36-788(+)|eukprot:CAMPEP_0181408970 /NCGR_PEP_ID=MMETSP1110-20121109/6575_1 /TAXON_ID=174948 /ORGANISM="Symbiodinium sp., Strain CCMP421" /LENGTH=250 /DNA_ID=CAMNT_0023531457 /DNA_START=32 /DNA_END=784 /DNA_ORIENTATION=-